MPFGKLGARARQIHGQQSPITPIHVQHGGFRPFCGGLESCLDRAALMAQQTLAAVVAGSELAGSGACQGYALDGHEGGAGVGHRH